MEWVLCEYAASLRERLTTVQALPSVVVVIEHVASLLHRLRQETIGLLYTAPLADTQSSPDPLSTTGDSFFNYIICKRARLSRNADSVLSTGVLPNNTCSAPAKRQFHRLHEYHIFKTIQLSKYSTYLISNLFSCTCVRLRRWVVVVQYVVEALALVLYITILRP